jgi:CHAD domain-containing protein
VNHSLAALRDAKVTLAAYDEYQQHPDRRRSDVRRTRLRRRVAMARSQLSVSARRAMATRLALVQDMVAGSPRSNAGWKAVAGAIRHEYAGGYRALAAARSEPSAANLHVLRKRSKGLLYLCVFLRKLSPHASSLTTPLKHIAACLGDYHDLVLLNRAIRSADLARRTARNQVALRKQAWQLGARIYCDAPSVFRKHIHGDWRRHR